MPFAGRDVPPLKVRASQAVTVLTVGVMNANKCVDRVIAAIGASPTLTGVVAYRLVGPIEPAEADRLATLAAEAGVDLAIHGAVADQELDAHLAAADVICCLRNPVLEGSSASAIEAMLAGRPLIVADAGFYGELPDELVFKVAADVPVADIMQALERLVADEPLRRRIGGKARAWAERSFSLAGYAQALEDLAGETLRALPVLSVGRQIGAELAGFGLGAQDAAIDRIGATLAEILPTV
jgi:glycosyltransferase involved in cell wall biosynthesis